MISITSVAASVLERSWRVIRHIAFSDMDQMAKGWGLAVAPPSPQPKRQPAIDLNFSLQSRRALNKHTKRMATATH